jgi:hypothetical protein
MAVSLRANIGESLSAFLTWLAKHPVDGDRLYGGSSVRYRVGRYCDYLAANPWPGGDPLREPGARDGAAHAYGIYLDTFNTPPATISLVLTSLDHFYLFLGLGRIDPRSPTTEALIAAARPRS